MPIFIIMLTAFTFFLIVFFPSVTATPTTYFWDADLFILALTLFHIALAD